MAALQGTPPAFPARSQFWNSRAMRRFRRNRLAVFGLLLVVLFIFTAVFAPLLAPPPKVGNNCLRDLGASESGQVYNIFGGVFWKALLTPRKAVT